MSINCYLTLDDDVRADAGIGFEPFEHSIPSQPTHPDVKLPEDTRWSSSGWPLYW